MVPVSVKVSVSMSTQLSKPIGEFNELSEIRVAVIGKR